MPVIEPNDPADGVCGLSGRAKVAGVMGWPVAHSLSPRLHGYWLRHYRIDGAYVPMPVRPQDLDQALAALAALGFVGVNVTIPHKEAALAAVHEVSRTARRIGAVNTIVVDEHRRLSATNTDAFGFIASLDDARPGWRAEHGPAVLLGAGGAARAIAVALCDAGAAEVRIVNRDGERARRLAERLGGRARAVAWSERGRALSGAGLLVNATSLGMAGMPALDLDVSLLPAHAPVVDIVYAPLRTALLASAADHGHAVVDGLGMLLHQARPAFKAWFGVDPEVTPALRAHIERALGAR